MLINPVEGTCHSQRQRARKGASSMAWFTVRETRTQRDGVSVTETKQ